MIGVFLGAMLIISLLSFMAGFTFSIKKDDE